MSALKSFFSFITCLIYGCKYKRFTISKSEGVWFDPKTWEHRYKCTRCGFVSEKGDLYE